MEKKPAAKRKQEPLAFKSPGVEEWRVFQVESSADRESKEKASSAKQSIHDCLLNSLQMQNIVVLAGSGTSLGSVGGPSMWDLWGAAIGEKPSAEAMAVASTMKYDLNAKGADNIEAFLSHADAYLQINEDEKIKQFVQMCKKTILEKCSDFLQVEKLKGHETFLHRLSRRRVRDPRLKLFTTNYDLCFETATSEIGGVVIDGFSFTSPRRYDPRFFTYDIVRRPRSADDQGSYLEGVIQLYKLHGSVNWVRTSDDVIYEKSSPAPDEACLIYPAKGKYQQSYIQPHLEQMSQYLAAIREPNTCLIVVGFGFNDDHLSEPIISAIKSNPHIRVLVVDPMIQSRQSSGAETNRYWTELSTLQEKGDDVWLINSSFQEFSNLIPDLKALTPAEKLFKVVKSAVSPKL